MTSRLYRYAAAGTLLLTLAACGSQTAGTGTSSTATTSSSSTASSTSSNEMSTSSTTSTASATSSDTTTTDTTSTTTSATGSTDPDTATSTSAEGATRTVLLDPTAADGSVAAGWTTTSIPNPCPGSFGVADASPFAKGRGVFTCGPNAANLLACWTFPAGKVGCIQGTGQLGRKLVTFASDIRYTGAAEPNPAPLAVELTDGTTCSTVGHDSANHWQGRNGWLYCTNGRMLLAKGDGTTSGYFDKSNPVWTADSVPQNGNVAPTVVRVASATYAQGS